MLALIQDAMHRGIDLDWNYAARQVDPACSGDALKQQLNKRRERLIAEGAPLVPISNRKRSTPRKTRSVQVQLQQMPDGNNQGLPAYVTQQIDTLMDISGPMGTMAGPQASKRLRSESEVPKKTSKKAKAYGGDDDVFGDEDDGALSESDVSDWASGKPAKKKAKRGRQAKNSLMVTLKTKKGHSASVSNVPLTPTSGASKNPKEMEEQEVSEKPTDKPAGPRKHRPKSYSTGDLSAANVFHGNGSQMVSPNHSIYGNSGMTNYFDPSANYNSVNQQLGGASVNAFLTHNDQYNWAVPGMQNNNFVFNTGTTAGNLNGADFNFSNMSQLMQPTMPHTPYAASLNGMYQFVAFIPHGPSGSVPHVGSLQGFPMTAMSVQPLEQAANIAIAGTDSDSTLTKDWDFPNAIVQTPVLSLETGVLPSVDFSSLMTDDLMAGGHFTTFDTPVAPAMPLPVGVEYETPSPTDISVASPQSLSQSAPKANNANYNQAAEAPKTPENQVIATNEVFGHVEHTPESNIDFATMLNTDLHDGNDNIGIEHFGFEDGEYSF